MIQEGKGIDLIKQNIGSNLYDGIVYSHICKGVNYIINVL